jgi:hypothetical protein
MLSPRNGPSQPKRLTRMHLLRVAEALQKQHQQRQRIELFAKWKLFVVMKAVGQLVQLSHTVPASLTSTNGGGPIPLTLLIKAGKRATIKKRVMSTTRIYRSDLVPSVPEGLSTTGSPSLDQLSTGLQAATTTSPTMSASPSLLPVSSITTAARGSVADAAMLVPSFLKGGMPPPSDRLSPTNEAVTIVSNNVGDGLADFLNGIGSCGATNSPAVPSEMPLTALAKEVLMLRHTMEAQKRTIEMRDRYINELVRKQDTDQSLRDIERDRVLQQAVSKLEALKAGRPRAGSRTMSNMPSSSTSPPSVPLVPPPSSTPSTARPPPPPPPATLENHSCQTSPLMPSSPSSDIFARTDVLPSTVPSPPSASPTTIASQSMRMTRNDAAALAARTHGRARNSVDSGSIAPGQLLLDNGVSPRGQPASAAMATAKLRKGTTTTASSSSLQKNSVPHSSEPVVVLAAQPQVVSLSISSVMRPSQVVPNHGNSGGGNNLTSHSVDGGSTDFVLLTSRSAASNSHPSSSVAVHGGGPSSQPTSSRKVPALRGTSLLPILQHQQQSSVGTVGNNGVPTVSPTCNASKALPA